MKLFYAVQATGNGHITRARVLAPKLKKAGIETTYLFTGRPWENLFEMEVFGEYQWRAGLTFSTRAGHIQYLNTVRCNNLVTFFEDVKNLDLSSYDVVLCDFEPVTAWAARRQGVRTLGISHQYAFAYDIPKSGASFMGKQVLKNFAPVDIHLGVHWHHFHFPIIPPVIETDITARPVRQEKIIVYLPFEEIREVVQLLKPFHEYDFRLYSPHSLDSKYDLPSHIHIYPLSRHAFQEDFLDAGGVICNSGFELSSEALHFGKKLLVKPLHGQMEQLSNALALEVLQLGEVMPDLDRPTVRTWLEKSQAIQVRFPDVAEHLAKWLAQGDLTLCPNWINSIWSQVHRSGA